jgi:hypothetical protein
VWTADERRVQHTRHHDVVHEATGAGKEPRVFAAWH